MSGAHHLSEQVLTPEYWGGNDIFNEEQFVAVPPPTDEVFLDRRRFESARRALIMGLGQVAAGNSTEVRYGIGNEFDGSSLGDGSLVIIGREQIVRHIFPNPRQPWRQYTYTGDMPSSRPYSAYWREMQRVRPRLDVIGTDLVSFDVPYVTYGRQLEWGVVVSQGDDRCLQTFSFDEVTLDDDGRVHAASYRQRGGFPVPAVPLPLRLGEVKVRRRLDVGLCTMDSMHRARSVDVVFPVLGSPQPSHRSAGERAGVLLGRLLQGTRPAEG